MTVIIPHHKTQTEVVEQLDKAAENYFANGVGGQVKIIDPRKSWQDSTMAFGFTAKVGFISVPLAGTLAVDPVNITVVCDLPNMVKSFVGEAKAKAAVENEISKIIT